MLRDLPVPFPRWKKVNNDKYIPQNKGLCIICGVECHGRRKTFCSEKCTQRYWSYYVWSGISKRILKRDNYTCQDCGYQQPQGSWNTFKDRPKPLHVHHIIPINEGGKSIDTNLITLCELCHRKRHRRGLKQNVTLDAFIGAPSKN